MERGTAAPHFRSFQLRPYKLRPIVTKWLDGSGYPALVTNVGLSLGDTVLHGDPAPPRGKGHSSPPTFWRMSKLFVQGS